MVIPNLSLKCNCCYTGLYMQKDGTVKAKTTLKVGETCSCCGTTMTAGNNFEYFELRRANA